MVRWFNMRRASKRSGDYIRFLPNPKLVPNDHSQRVLDDEG
jgi:hypothetical protein